MNGNGNPKPLSGVREYRIIGFLLISNDMKMRQYSIR